MISNNWRRQTIWIHSSWQEYIIHTYQKLFWVAGTTQMAKGRKIQRFPSCAIFWCLVLKSHFKLSIWSKIITFSLTGIVQYQIFPLKQVFVMQNKWKRKNVRLPLSILFTVINICSITFFLTEQQAKEMYLISLRVNFNVIFDLALIKIKLK